MNRLALMVLAAGVLAPAISAAQITLRPPEVTPVAPTEAKPKPTAKLVARTQTSSSTRSQGWGGLLSLKSNISLGGSSNVIGRPDGVTASLGANITGRLRWRRGPREWLSTLSAQIQFTRAPPLDQLIKSLDQFKIESTYANDLPSVKWLSFYGTFSLETQLFEGRDVRTDPVSYVIREAGSPPGAPFQPVATGTELLLTRELAPTLLAQGTGLRFLLVDRKETKLSVRAGIGAVQALVRDGVALIDNPRTPEIELLRLEDYAQVGAQTRFEISGQYTKIVHYSATVDFLFPFYTSVTRGLSVLELTNIDLAVKVGVKLGDWVGLSYVLGVRRYPLLVNAFQVWNGLLVSFGYTLRSSGPTRPARQPPAPAAQPPTPATRPTAAAAGQ